MTINEVKLVTDAIRNYMYTECSISPIEYASKYSRKIQVFIYDVLYSETQAMRLANINRFEEYFSSNGMEIIDREVFRLVGLEVPRENIIESVSEVVRENEVSSLDSEFATVA
jgi:hypothetical protein